MRNYKLDNELKDLSQSVYKGNSNYTPKCYIEIGSYRNSRTGFDAKVFYNNNNIIIVFRGSDELKDWTSSNINMAISKLPQQSIDAINLYKQIKKQFPHRNIILSGHSLAGSLAQIVGSETGVQTVTFNAYGTKGIKYNAKYKDNITNYGNAHDVVYMSNLDNQVGNTYILNDYKTNQGYVYRIAPSTHAWKYSFNAHRLENLGDLSKALEYHKDIGLELGNRSNQVFKASVEYNRNIDSDGNKIYTKEDLDKMSKEDIEKNHDKIMQQVQTSRGTKVA